MRRRLVLSTAAYGVLLAVLPTLLDPADALGRFLAGIAVGAVLLAALLPEGLIGTAAVLLLAGDWALGTSYGAVPPAVLPAAAGAVWVYADLLGLGARVPADVAVDRGALLSVGGASLGVGVGATLLGLGALAVGTVAAPAPLGVRVLGMLAALAALALPVLLLRTRRPPRRGRTP